MSLKTSQQFSADRRLGWASRILDCLFPPRCAGCGHRGNWFCTNCRDNLARLPRNRCRRCGMPLRSGRTCGFCTVRPRCIEGLRVDYYFEGPLRRAIHHFKYHGHRHLAEPLGELLADSFTSRPMAVDILVPVPLHPRRLAERGYNQSALLAGELTVRLGLPLVDGLVIRSRHTLPQMQLPAERRNENVQRAFTTTGNAPRGQTVLLVDDVCTTGSTLDACAQALREAGCRQVWGITLARAR